MHRSTVVSHGWHPRIPSLAQKRLQPRHTEALEADSRLPWPGGAERDVTLQLASPLGFVQPLTASEGQGVAARSRRRHGHAPLLAIETPASLAQHALE